MFNDLEWLGQEHAELGPCARAAIGVLLANENWNWWRHPDPDFVADHLGSRGSTLTWGGILPVYQWADWIDRQAAIAAARGWISFLDSIPLGGYRLRVAGTKWLWSDPIAATRIYADLARAGLPRSSIIVSWPSRKGQKRNAPDSATMGSGMVVGWLGDQGETAAKAFADGLTMDGVTTSEAPAQADVLVTRHTDRLSAAKIQARLAILLVEDPTEVLSRVEDVRSAFRADCIIALPMGQSGLVRDIASGLAGGKPLDRALSDAQATDALVVSTQRFVARSHRFAHSGEKYTSSSVDFDRIVRRRPVPKRKSPETGPIKGPVARILRGWVSQDGKVVKRLPTGGVIDVYVRIEPIGPLVALQPEREFPDKSIHWATEWKKLRVHAVSLFGYRESRELLLPRRGPSEPVVFPYALAAEHPLDLRIIVSDGPTILQTGRLRQTEDRTVEYWVEALNASVEAPVAPFDLSLVVNDSLGGENKPSATINTGDVVDVLDLTTPAIHATLQKFRKYLNELTSKDAPDINFYVWQLVQHGRALRAALMDKVSSLPEEASRIQVSMASKEAYFPIEFLFDYEVPDLETQLCEQIHMQACLENGKAKDPCAFRSEKSRLCPMGFWGINRIIERRAWEEKLEPAMQLRLGELPRDQIPPIKKILFGAADKADKFKEELSKDEAANYDDIEAVSLALTVPVIRTWTEWRKRLAQDTPDLLLLVAHNSDDILYIGQNSPLGIGQLEGIVGPPQSIFVALGCNTAAVEPDELTLPNQLRIHGVTVFVGALTSVLGRHTNITARRIAEMIREESQGPTRTTIGEIIQKLRRELLASGNPLSFAITAFGDANIALGGIPSAATR